MTISLGGANRLEELANASLRFIASSFLGGAGFFFSWDFLYDMSTSYEPGGGIAYEIKKQSENLRKSDCHQKIFAKWNHNSHLGTVY